MHEHSNVSAGVRAGLPLVLPTLALGVSFGVLARPVMGPVAPIAMSIFVFSGAAQFAALSVLAAGGGAVAAITAGMLMNARWLPMGFAIGPSLRGGPLARAAQGQTIVDASFVIASRGDGSFDRGLLMGATAAQAVAWVSGTVIGVVAGPVLGDPASLGLDAIFVAFYLALLVEEARSRRAMLAGLAGAAIAFALMPFTPAGVPIIAASLAALVGLRTRMTTAWIVVAVLFVGTATMRAAGPVAFGGRSLSGRGAAVVGLVAPAILGALVVYETVSAGAGGVVLDARLLGLAAAVLALVLRVPLIAVVLAAALATALARLL